MNFWAGLQKDGDKEMLIEGVDTMMKIAVRLLSQNGHATGRRTLMIEDGGKEDPKLDQEPDAV